MLVLILCARAVSAMGAGHSELLTKENIVDAARPKTAWQAATIGQALYEKDRLRTGEFSRATVRLTNSAVLRVRELTTLLMLPPEKMSTTPTVDLKAGAIFMMSRERPLEINLRSPVVTGAARGTEFHAEVSASGKTVVTMFEGALDLRNEFGSLTIRSGEQATVEPGGPPVRTAVIEAVNIIQWCLYYPGVLDPAELGMSAAERTAVEESLAAYRQGDLLQALRAYPTGYFPASAAGKMYRAALVLEVGEVEKAAALLRGVPQQAPGREALEQMIAAVKFQHSPRRGPPRTASEWMAESYYQQSGGNLEAALQAAEKATELAPNFGFTWTRVAELEFSFGRTARAQEALAQGLRLAPRHAQAQALSGFLLAAQNRIGAAQRAFNEAIALDGALGNAWLGRGLTYIRQGQAEEGRRRPANGGSARAESLDFAHHISARPSVKAAMRQRRTPSSSGPRNSTRTTPRRGSTPRSRASRRTATTRRSTISKNRPH